MKKHWNLTLEQYTGLCKQSDKQGLVQVLPLLDGGCDTIFYDACVGNLYSAVKRQCIEVTQPEPIMLANFLDWYSRIFDDEIVPILDDFEYCEFAWYNGLTAGQQKEIDDANCFEKANTTQEGELSKRFYSMFCKREKQLVDDHNKNPKNRCICAPNAEYKYVMGPVVARLDIVFRKFKGYCAGKSWEEMEQVYNDRASRGLTKTVEGDGSGFDRTQTHELKTVERQIYMYLLDAGKIHHVGYDVFKFHVEQEWHKIYVTHKEVGVGYVNFVDLGHVSVRGTVLSGSMDTTFANTLRMALYNRYVAEEYLNLSDSEYDIDAKGDDFALFVDPSVLNSDIKNAYYSVFSKQKTGVYGLGQILKFLKIGEIDTLDFCSTDVFWSESQNSYKIVRQLSRFIQLTGWSHTVLSLTREDREQYLHALYEANRFWMKDLPIFSEYNDLMKQNIFTKAKPKKGPIRKVRYTEKSHLYGVKYKHALTLLTYSSDDYYAFADRISNKENCATDYRNHLIKHYNLADTEIDFIQEVLSNCKDGSAFYLCQPLIDAFDYKKDISHVEIM